MKNILLLLACFISILSCGNQNRTKNIDDTASENTQVAVLEDELETMEEDTTYRETLNDIRFAGWTKEDWADNEYIREVRRYIDAYNVFFDHPEKTFSDLVYSDVDEETRTVSNYTC